MSSTSIFKSYREERERKARIKPLTIGQGIAIAGMWIAMAGLQGLMYWIEHLDPTDLSDGGWTIIVFIVVFHYPIIAAWMLTKRLSRRHWDD